MKPTISTISVPVGTEISRHLVGADFKDCYALAIASDAPFALAIFLSMVAKTPAWVNHLMAIRNRAVALVGLKDLGHLGAINPPSLQVPTVSETRSAFSPCSISQTMKSS